MVEVGISSDFPERGISVRLGLVRGAVMVSDDAPGLGAALESEAGAALAQIEATPIAEMAPVAATRRAYKALGKDPARYRPSAEALMRRIKQGKGLYRVSTAVDVVNLASIRSGISIGAYDVSRLRPPVVLRRAGAGESYAGIGRGPLNLEGLPVLADAEGPFGCPTSDSERTRIRQETADLLLVLFGFGAAEGLEQAVDFAVRSLERWCGARDPEVRFVEA